MKNRNDSSFFLCVLCVLCVLCGISCDDDAGSTQSQNLNSPPVKWTLQLNWVPEPQFGGFYEAERIGAYTRHDLHIEIVPGGAGTPTVQMIGANSAQFGVVSADEIVIARSRGNDVVALFAVYQTNPQGIMTHAARNFADVGDVFKNPGTLAMQRGLPYADFLIKKYGTAPNLRIVPSPGGSISAFLADPNFSQQCFVTSEPILARQQGANPKTFLVADAGYNPYTTVLAVSGSMYRAAPDKCRRMALAVREGWASYLRDPGPMNERLHALNKTMDPRTILESAAAQKPLIEGEETKQKGLGAMTKERWATLIQQLVDLKVIDKAPSPEECYVELPPVTTEAR